MGGSIHHVSRRGSTSPAVPGTLSNGVGDLVELQVNSRAAGQVGEALGLSDVVLHFLEVCEQGGLLGGSAVQLSFLHRDADGARVQCLLSHPERLGDSKQEGFLVFTFVITLINSSLCKNVYISQRYQPSTQAYSSLGNIL